MTPETKEKLIAKRKEVTEKLIDQGIDRQQARFMVISAGLKPEGLLKDQPDGDEKIDAELAEITIQARKETPIVPRADTAAGLARDLHREWWCQ